MNIKCNPMIVFLPLILSLFLAACSPELVLTPVEQPTGGAAQPTSGDLDIIISSTTGQQSGGEDIIINILPEEYLIYQSYLEAINARPAMADFGGIEGTVLSVIPGEVCPYQEEECPIEPYPNDWGIIRVDRVLSYAPFSGGDTEPIIEQPAANEGGEVPSISGSQGQDIAPKESSITPLFEGQEVTTQFILTARPVIIRNLPGDETGTSAASSNLERGAEDTIEQSAQPKKILYKSLPKDGGVYIFTTKVGDVSEQVAKNLPGLEVGTRFRTEVRYDGILYINDYEIIP